MLIVIEGPDGAGKTEASKALAAKLGVDWMCFPDRATPIGNLIDAYLKGSWRVLPVDRLKIDEMGLTEDPRNALVFQGLQLASRVEHLPRLQAAVEEGRPLVCDRYWQSGYAYGVLDKLDPKYLISIHAGLPSPDLSILIDVPVEVSAARQKNRGSPAEHYERLDVLQQIRDNYLKLWHQRCRDSRWKVVDGSAGKEEVVLALWDLVTTTVKWRNLESERQASVL